MQAPATFVCLLDILIDLFIYLFTYLFICFFGISTQSLTRSPLRTLKLQTAVHMVCFNMLSTQGACDTIQAELLKS